MQVRVDIDQSGVYSMVNTFTRGLREAERFVVKEVERVLRREVFDGFVRRLCYRAGPGWPQVYTDHLVAMMRLTIPINVYTSEGYLSITYDLDGLGDYSDLELGAHMRAIEAISEGQFGYTKKGKSAFERHPPLVELPYQGQPLYNDGAFDDRRTEFWEQVIVDRDLSFEIGMKKGKAQATAADLGYIPTFEEIAFERVTQAWAPIGKAPQWLWLENGFNETAPEIYSVDFSRSLELVSECIAGEIYESEIIQLVELAEASGGAVNTAGRPFDVNTGRFLPYRERLNSNVDFSRCLGDI